MVGGIWEDHKRGLHPFTLLKEFPKNPFNE
jgi:hypothetical protein